MPTFILKQAKFLKNTFQSKIKSTETNNNNLFFASKKNHKKELKKIILKVVSKTTPGDAKLYILLSNIFNKIIAST